MIKKSAISLISYDSEYLPDSIAKYYDFVDEIILGLDKDRISWSNNSFKFDENKLWKDLKTLDVKNKIEVIEENFHPSKVSIFLAFKICSHHIHILSNCPFFCNYYAFIFTNTICMMLMLIMVHARTMKTSSFGPDHLILLLVHRRTGSRR